MASVSERRAEPKPVGGLFDPVWLREEWAIGTATLGQVRSAASITSKTGIDSTPQCCELDLKCIGRASGLLPIKGGSPQSHMETISYSGTTVSSLLKKESDPHRASTFSCSHRRPPKCQSPFMRKAPHQVLVLGKDTRNRCRERSLSPSFQTFGRLRFSAAV